MRPSPRLAFGAHGDLRQARLRRGRRTTATLLTLRFVFAALILWAIVGRPAPAEPSAPRDPRRRRPRALRLQPRRPAATSPPLDHLDASLDRAGPRTPTPALVFVGAVVLGPRAVERRRSSSRSASRCSASLLVLGRRRDRRARHHRRAAGPRRRRRLRHLHPRRRHRRPGRRPVRRSPRSWSPAPPSRVALHRALRRASTSRFGAGRLAAALAGAGPDRRRILPIIDLLPRPRAASARRRPASSRPSSPRVTVALAAVVFGETPRPDPARSAARWCSPRSSCCSAAAGRVQPVSLPITPPLPPAAREGPQRRFLTATAGPTSPSGTASAPSPSSTATSSTCSRATARSCCATSPRSASRRGRYVLDGELVAATRSTRSATASTRPSRASSAWRRRRPRASSRSTCWRSRTTVLLDLPYGERRALLEKLAGIEITPQSCAPPAEAEALAARRRRGRHRQGARRARTGPASARAWSRSSASARIDAVVIGWRPGKAEGTRRRDDPRPLRRRRRAARRSATPAGFTAKEKRELVETLAPYETGERGSGDPSRWTARPRPRVGRPAPRAGRRDHLRPRHRRPHPPRHEGPALARRQAAGRVHRSTSSTADMAARGEVFIDAGGRELRVSSADRVIFPATERTPSSPSSTSSSTT